MEVLNTIKTIRIDRGLNLRDLAKLSGVSASAISLIERGEMQPTQSVMLKLSRSLNLQVCQVFHLECNMYTCEICLTKRKVGMNK